MLRDLGVLARRASAAIRRADTTRLVVLGYASYIIAGWALLCLPFSRKLVGPTALDHLFTATSAVSTTGLVTCSTSDTYTLFGQIVILVMIQLGGIGYMTAGSFIVLAVSGDVSMFRRRVSLAVFNLPEGFSIKSFLHGVVAYTLVIEVVGALALYPVFVRHGSPQPAWQAIFHSVSAFCTAGFGLPNNSFESFASDVWLNLVILVLSYLGAIGFIVPRDVWRSMLGRKPAMTLTSKIILAATFWISVVGTLLFAINETTVQAMPRGPRWMAAWFQVATASTTVGFNTIPIGQLSASSVFLLTMVMIIGASPSGTGGGLKTTTFSALWAMMMSVIRRQPRTTYFGRVIPLARLRAAVASAVFYVLTLAVGVYLLSLVETAPLPDQMFECASAIGTVGLSRGITASLSSWGKVILIALMFVGRIGPVALGMSLTKVASKENVAPRRLEDLAV